MKDLEKEIQKSIDYLRASLPILREAAKGNLPQCAQSLKQTQKIIGQLVDYLTLLRNIRDGR